MKVFGINGEVIVKPTTDSVTRFKNVTKILTGKREDEVEEKRVDHITPSDRGIRMKFRGTDDRTTAEKLLGDFLFVPEEQLARLPQGSHYIHQLIGLRVIDQYGEVLGTIKDVLRMPANDVYIIDARGKEVLFPAVKEFVKEIDVTGGVIRVMVIEGLVE